MFTNKTFLIALILILALAWVHWVSFVQSQPHYVDGEAVTVSGNLTEEPTQSGYLFSFKLKGLRILTDQANLHYGDKIQVVGKVSNSVIFLPQIEILAVASPLNRLTNNLRSLSKEKIDYLFPEPEAGLVNGVLLGLKSSLTSELTSALKRNGTIHVAVVSGYNITVVAGLFLALAPYIRRKRAVVLSIAAIFFYAAITGFSGPTLRAVLMAAIAYLGVLSGRVVYPLYALFLTAVILYFVDPAIIFDVGFQLSFLATAGILLFSQPLQSLNLRLPRLIKEDLLVSLSAQSLVVPVIFFYFGTVSLISPLANALTLWVIPFATIASLVVLCISFIYLPLASLLALIILLPVKYFVWVNLELAKIPFAAIPLEKSNIFFTFAYFLFLSSLIAYLIQKDVFKKAQ